MRPWLLLASLLVSDPSLLGDGDRMVENYSWGLQRKPPLNGQMTPQGPEVLQAKTEHPCIGIQRKCVHVAVQRKLRTSLSYWTYTVHVAQGCSLSHQEFTGIIQENHNPALVVALLVPGSRVRPDTQPALRAAYEIASITADTRRVTKEAIKGYPGSHRTAAPGRDFQALLLEESKSWAAATVAQLQKALTKRYRAHTAAIASCCFKEGGITPAASIKKTSKQQTAQPQVRQRESTKRARGIKVLTRRGEHQSSQASAGRRDIFHSASLQTDSSSERTSDASQLKMHRSGARIMKRNERLTSGEEAKRAQGQRASKAAASYDEDGFHVDRPRLLTSTQKAQSINGPTRDDNEEDFSGEEITKQAELQRLGEGSETEQTHTNAVGNGNQKRSASILHAGSTHKRDNKHLDHKQLLTEAGKEVLIALTWKGEPLFKTDWETVNILTKEPGDPPLTKVLKENFIIEAHESKCTCLAEVSLEIYVLNSAEWRAIKPAQSKATTVPTHTEEHTRTNGTPHKNMNHAKQEENEPSGESVTPSTPSLTMMQLETTKAEQHQTTSSGENEVSPPSTVETPMATAGPRSEAGPRFTRCQAASTQPAAERSLSGLRMREAFPAIKLHEATEDGERDVTNGPDAGRKGVRNDSRVNVFAETLQTTTHKGAADEIPEITDVNKPLCGGLIHRTEAGWRHCVERFSSSEPGDAFEDRGGPRTARTHVQDDKDGDGEDDHFYYFDGVLKRVQNYFFPHQKRQRLQKRGLDNEGNRAFTGRERGDNLLGYIRRLTLRNKLSHFK